MDSFRWGKELSKNIKFDANEDAQEYVLDSTCGDYTENANNLECAYDGEWYHEDEMCYSDIDDSYYYCDNCTYIEERDTYANIDEAVYNSYTGNYHYSGDIE